METDQALYNAVTKFFQLNKHSRKIFIDTSAQLRRQSQVTDAIYSQHIGNAPSSQGIDKSLVKASNNEAAQQLIVIQSSTQHITVEFLYEHSICRFTFVYANACHVERRLLLLELISLQCAFDGPWLVTGDLNAVIGAHKKVGGNLPKCVSCDEFVAKSDICGLIHLDTKRGHPILGVMEGVFVVTLRCVLIDVFLIQPDWMCGII
ncbi:hypothetical protein L1049_027554 [Liquidambar formosana]|uniref:Uncharacterized protein n=1 Tax=Liquidambar formosana TaxID=63359 RepID=A0AAP0RIZ3_LIQFO